MARGRPAKGRRLRVGGVALLILFSALSVSPSPVERRNGPIRLRENLWATGHFMGKKSPLSPIPLHSSSLERAELNHTPGAFSPSVTSIIDSMKDLLIRELLEILLQQKLLEENQGKQDPEEQHHFSDLQKNTEIAKLYLLTFPDLWCEVKETKFVVCYSA
ncbi:hypothetical protein Chor_000094 [Crotalus horridus]